MRLKITTPKRSFDFTSREGSTVIVVGTRPLDDLCIDDDPKVSGPHVRLEGSANDWSFTDQFSDAGTMHNGTKTYNGDLKVGDVLQVGDTLIKVLEFEGAQTSLAPATEPVFDTSMPAPFSPPAVETPPGLEVVAELPALGVHEQRLYDRLISQFEFEHNISLRGDAAALLRIREAAQKAVLDLENAKSTDVNLPYIAVAGGEPRHLSARLARKHLHEEWRQPDHAPKQSTPANEAVYQAAPEAPQQPRKNNKAGAVVAVGFVVVFAAIMIAVDVLDGGTGPEQDVRQMLDEAQAREDADNKRKQEEERLLQQAVVALMEDRQTPPQTLMDALDRLEAGAKAQGLPVGWDFERARTYLEGRVYSDVAKRSNDAGLAVYNHQEAKSYRQALAEIEAFKTYLDSSPHHDRANDVLKLDDSVTNWREVNEIGNDRLLYEKLYAVEETLSRDDFSQAAVELRKVIDDAVVDEVARAALELECAEVERQASMQHDEKLPAKRMPFERSRDRLPAAPRNTLLPDGDRSTHEDMSALRDRVEEQVQAMKWDARKWPLWRLELEIVGDPSSSQVVLTVSRPAGGGRIAGRHVVRFGNLPASIQFSMMEQVESGSVQERLALLIYCFDNGLMEDAGRMALKVREAAPGQLAELDEILAGKWKVAVPEGGFKERDGRVVPD
jgi:pSer/pThr/pTyr-binding forkhead associated (FHA) protein